MKRSLKGNKVAILSSFKPQFTYAYTYILCVASLNLESHEINFGSLKKPYPNIKYG